MTERNETMPEKQGFIQKVKNFFNRSSKTVSNKVEDMIDDVKESEYGEKVSQVAKNVGEKARDVIEDVKDSKFAEKVTETAKNVGEKACDIVEDVKDSKFAEKVGDAKDVVVEKAKEFGGEVSDFYNRKVKGLLGKIAGIPALSKAAAKFQASPENTDAEEEKLDGLDCMVARIIEDGVITPEEEQELVQKANELGIDADQFMTEVREKMNK